MSTDTMTPQTRPGVKEYPSIEELKFVYDHCLGCHMQLEGYCDVSAGEIQECMNDHAPARKRESGF